uniref:Uncharacterized protein n=1 Tax=Arundo donax TaxID=35708 RepID=A0A0A8ZHL7_ARUDO
MDQIALISSVRRFSKFRFSIFSFLCVPGK